MSLFRRKPRADARAALKDPVFAATAPGVDHVHIDYDPGVWLRCPTVGVDRTSWVEESLAAYADDLRLAPGSETHTGLRAALDAIANQSMDAMATFVSFAPKLDNHMTATINVLDDELMMLENGTPEAFLTFANDLSRPPATPSTFAGAFQISDRAAVTDDGGMVNLEHAHRALDTDPLLHLAGVGILTSAFDTGKFATLFFGVKVHLADGRVL